MSDGSQSTDDWHDYGLPTELFAEAGHGSLTAQRQLRDMALMMAKAGTAPFDQAMSAAEVLARMVSANGDPSDARVLAEILFSRADTLSPSEDHKNLAAAEAIALLEEAADAGDGGALDRLVEIKEVAPRSVFTLASHLRGSCTADQGDC